MSKYIIQGGKPLSGTIDVAGNKNAVLPIMAATIVVSGDTKLNNVPRINDVSSMAEILVALGAKVEGIGSNVLVINTDSIKSHKVRSELARKLRASVLLLGPLYARFGTVDLAHPGGDIIGIRSIDTHLNALEALGANVTATRLHYSIKKSKSTSREVNTMLDEPSVTATENIMMASALGNQSVSIENAASEPHIVDLSDFLNKCGARIKGAGTHKISIQGVSSLKSIEYRIAPDYLEVGTFAVLSALTGGSIGIRNVRSKDLQLPIRILKSMGISIRESNDILYIQVKSLQAPEKKIQASPHPGFPTDLMSPFIVLATQVKGETLLHDPMYESRMFFVDKLINMGAQITICDPHRVIVNGPTRLHGSYQSSPDIRAGVALVIAALIAKGESIIDHAEIVERGYEKIAKRLTVLGADIQKVE